MLKDELISPTAVKRYLSTTPSIPPLFSNPTLIEILSGGSANFTYRLHLKDNDAEGQSSVVIKCFMDYAASMPSLALDLGRWDFERLALDILPNLLNQPLVKIPTLHFSSSSPHHLLIQSDAHPTSLTLKALFLRPTPLPIEFGTRIGALLGGFLGSLHSLPQNIVNQFDNVKARDLCAWRTFGRIQGVAGDLFKVGQREAGRIRSEEKGKELTMGDFWTGNVLIFLSPTSDTVTLERATVVDWELAHSGCGLRDVAQFSAEAWLSARFAPDPSNVAVIRATVKEFHRSYVVRRGWETGGEEGKERVKKVMLSAGAHIAVWVAKAGWTDDGEKVHEVEKEGVNMAWAAEGVEGMGEADVSFLMGFFNLT